MYFTIRLFGRLLSSSLLCAALLAGTSVPAQQTATPPPASSDDIVRVETELIQTDVMVFDNQGRFVSGLKPEQFLLRVDGQPQQILFFERVTTGSVDEERQLAAARGGARPPKDQAGATIKPLDRGRSIFFFVDDLHLAPASSKRTRETLLNFINIEMTQNDEAAVSSASGRLGFLQQLTDEKAVLRAAVAKLNSASSSRGLDFERPHMSEYQALAVEGNNRDVLAVFTEYILRDNPLMRRDTAENIVRSRARNILQQSANFSSGTLGALESLVRSTSLLPGRKIIFFLSDGFFIDRNIGDTFDRLRRITDAAARAGVVIYTMDTQGLVTGQPDVSVDVPFDPSGRLAINDIGEVSAQQAPLFTLAADTGGRALVNTNNLERALTKAVKDSSVYYLLAWQPGAAQGEERKKAKFRRIEVSIAGHPELKVQVRRGFFDAPPPSVTETKSGKKQTDGASKSVPAGRSAPEAKALFEALLATYPKNALPISLTLNYLNTAGTEMQLACTVQVNVPPLAPVAAGERTVERVELIGAVYDEGGKLVAPFQNLLPITPEPAGADGDGATRRVISTQQMAIKPGLHQVRVAARHPASGQIGSTTQWITIPDLKKGALALSSILIGERKAGQNLTADGSAPVLITADRRFSRDSWLRLLFSSYNAKTNGAGGPPDLALQIQIFRDDQPVVTFPLKKIDVSAFTDFTFIPYAAELPLNDLPPGRYLLKLTVIDRIAKTSAAQQTKFVIE
ncbi:MAG: VWA domain-containing protein [Pyrinomonadaceae bacterium]|nr:VWA domain-containing protein [Pyrinomonadaceae bacterium]